jgi:hypothetical protein
MTTIYYVDYEGEAGTGDGSSFANRAKSFAALGSNTQYLGDGDHEVRIKKSPKKNLGSGSVRRRGHWHRNGYDAATLADSSSYWSFSTTQGQTKMRWNNHGLETGDWIEIWGNKWYYNDAAYGDGSTSQVMTNLIGLNGRWRVTCPDTQWIQLDQYTGHMNSGESDSWSTRKITTSDHGKWFDVSGSVVDFPANNPLPLKEICSNGMGNRVKWTAESNCTTYDPWYQFSSWNNNTWNGANGALDRFNITSSMAQNAKCAYFELPATLDLSAYQGVTYELTWYSGSNQIWQGSSAANPKGQFSLRLCTDTAGATSVHTIPIDTSQIVRSSSCRGHVEWELSSGNLNAAIKSVAIYKDGNVVNNADFAIGNVCAYKTGADRLIHNYKIGLNTTDDDQWYTIKGIDVEKNCLKIATSARYYHQQMYEFGYYGGPLSCRWSDDKTNVDVYSMKSYFAAEDPNGFDGTNGFNTYQNSSGENDKHIVQWKRFGNGVSATNLKKISGGWDDTNMSTQGATDLTWFDGRHANASYGGFFTSSSDNTSQGARYQHIDRLGFSLMNTHFGGREGKLSNIHIDLAYQVYVYTNEPQTVGFKQWTFTAHPNSDLMANQNNNTGIYRTEANKANNYIKAWGGDGSSEWFKMGYGRGVWSELNFEGCYGIYFQGGQNNTSYVNKDNITVDLLKTGWYGREQQGVQIADTMKGMVIKNWESLYNRMQIYSNSEVTIHDFTYDKGTQNSGKYGNSSVGNYCIYWQSPNITVLGGTTNRRFYFTKAAKLSGITNTDSQEPSISGDETEIMFANINGVAGAGKYLRNGWYIEPETATRHTASGKAWKLTKTSSSYTPKFTLAKVAVAGSGTVTAKVWVYRTVSGTGTYAILRIPSDTTLGLTSSTELNSTNGAANQWYELSVTAQPTTAGIMDIELELHDDTNSGFIIFDDMTITQT